MIKELIFLNKNKIILGVFILITINLILFFLPNGLWLQAAHILNINDLPTSDIFRLSLLSFFIYFQICLLISLGCLYFYRQKPIEFFLFIVSTTLTMLVLEFLLSEFYPQVQPHYQYVNYHPQLGWENRKGAKGILNFADEYYHPVQINEQGFRSQKKEDLRDSLLVLGDSFTTNFQVPLEKSFPFLLSKTGLFKTVINAGVNGYGQVQEYLYLNELLKNGELPKHILVNIYLGNDLEDNRGLFDWSRGYKRPKAMLNRGKVEITFTNGEAPKKKEFRLPLQNISKLIQRAISRIKKYFIKDYEISFPQDVLPEILNCKLPESETLKSDIELCAALLGEMKSKLDSLGIDLSVMISPSQSQIDPVYWQKVSQVFNLNPDQFDLSLVGKKLKEAIGKKGIACLDLYNTLKESSDPTTLYYALDHHWTPRANKIVAQTLVEFFMLQKKKK